MEKRSTGHDVEKIWTNVRKICLLISAIGFVLDIYTFFSERFSVEIKRKKMDEDVENETE